MKKILLIVFLLMTTVAGFAQRTIALSPFTAIDVFGPFEVELIKSDKASIEIDYRGIDEEDIVAEVQHDVLKLKIKNRHYMKDWSSNSYRKSDYARVKVYYTDIDVLEAQAGALITSLRPVKSKLLMIDCSMGAEITLDIFAKKVEVVSNMGGVLELTGQTEQLEVKANMGGVFKGSRLESKIVYVKASMGADVMVNVSEELDASAGLGATIDYVGGPNVRHTSKSMGGEVNRRSN